MYGTSRSAANFLLAACLIGVATAGCSHPEEAAAGPQKETAGQSVTGSVTLSNKDRTAFKGAPMPADAQAKMVQWIQSHSANSSGASHAAIPAALQRATTPGK